MELNEGSVQLGNDEVFVVARIANQGHVLGVTGQIVGETGVGEEFATHRSPFFIEEGTGFGTGTVEAIEFEDGGAEVFDRFGIDAPFQTGSGVEREIVVDKLS